MALLPEPTVRREVRARTLAAMPLFGRGLTRPLGIIHRRRHKLSAAAQSFLDLLRADGNGSASEADSAARASHRGRNGTIKQLS